MAIDDDQVKYDYFYLSWNVIPVWSSKLLFEAS